LPTYSRQHYPVQRCKRLHGGYRVHV